MKDAVNFLKNIPKALIKQGEGSKHEIDKYRQSDDLPMALIKQGSHSQHKKKDIVKEGLDLSGDSDSDLYSTLKKLHGYHDQTLHRALSDHYKFSPEHASALDRYTDDSQILNSHIYDYARFNKAGPNVDFLKEHGYDLHGLDAALSDKPLPHDLQVYSGVRFNPADVKNESGLIHLPAYTSTSLYPHVAVPFSTGHADHDHDKDITHHHILRINLPSGSMHGAYIAHHSPADNDIKTSSGVMKPNETGEREFLLGRGAIIRVDNAPYDQHTSKTQIIRDRQKITHTSKFHFWDAHIVGHKNYD